MEGSQKVATSVTQLQEAFGIEGSIDVVEGTGGLPKVILRHACGAAAEIYLFGACVTSWKQPSGNEVLYMRPDAVFDKSKPISGGIPICFPQVALFAITSIVNYRPYGCLVWPRSAAATWLRTES